MSSDCCELTLGTGLTSTVTFRLPSDDGGLTPGDPFDPGTVTLSILLPDGTVLVDVYGEPGSIIVRDSVGVYHAYHVPPLAGVSWYQWKGDLPDVVAEHSASVRGTFVP